MNVNLTCSQFCGSRPCEFQGETREGRIVHLEVHPKMRFPPCAKGWTNIQRLYHPERLLYPMKRAGERGDGKWQRITWDEALDTIVNKLNESKGRYGNESIAVYVAGGRRREEPINPRSLLARLFNLWGGFLNVRHQGGLAGANGRAMLSLFGNGEIDLPPANECKRILVWGRDAAESVIRSTMSSYLDAKERGTKFVIINPIFTRLAAVLADEYVPINPGTDAALALAMINIIIQEGLYDTDFILKYTNAPFLVREDSGCLLTHGHIPKSDLKEYSVWDSVNGSPQFLKDLTEMPPLSGCYEWEGTKVKTVWQLLLDAVRQWPPARASSVTGVPAETIIKLAKDFAIDRPAQVAIIGGGSLGFLSGAENTCKAIQLLNVITGNVRGSYKTPERGLDFGIGLVSTAENIESPNPIVKSMPVNHLAEAILNPARYNTNIRFLFCMAANPASQHADSNKNITALAKLDFTVVCDLFITATARYADILLPACMPWETSFIIEGSEVGKLTEFYRHLDLKPKRQIFYSQKAIEPMGESKDDLEIICELASKMGYSEYFPWENAEEYIEDILAQAKENPSFPWLKGITTETLKEEGIVDIDMSLPISFMEFRTPTKKIEIYSASMHKQGWDPIPVYRDPAEGISSTPELFQKYPLHLLTPTTIWRSHSRFGNQPELLEFYTPDVLINTLDASKRGIDDGDLVEVFNNRGSLEIKATVSEAIKPGVVRIYIGGTMEQGIVNVLTSDRLTGYAMAPTFNTSLVEVRKKN